MNEFVSKINFGKRVTLHHKVFVDNIVRIEYIQGIFKGMENDVYVIEQHFPFNNLLDDLDKSLIGFKKTLKL